jgi:hypothetical protein
MEGKRDHERLLGPDGEALEGGVAEGAGRNQRGHVPVKPARPLKHLSKWRHRGLQRVKRGTDTGVVQAPQNPCPTEENPFSLLLLGDPGQRRLSAPHKERMQHIESRRLS